MNARSFIDKDEHKDVCERIIKKEYMNYFFTQHKPDMTRVTLRIGAYDLGSNKKAKRTE